MRRGRKWATKPGWLREKISNTKRTQTQKSETELTAGVLRKNTVLFYIFKKAFCSTVCVFLNGENQSENQSYT